MSVRVYNIRAGLTFADQLALGLLQETENDPLSLAQIRIFLPTRRACRVLRDSFLRLTKGRPMLLPQMQPIGDVQDDEPALLENMVATTPSMLAVAPSIPSLRRQLILARTIMAAPDLGATTPEQAVTLARALAQLLDQVHTESKDIASLRTLVPGDEAYWQVTVKFLNVLSDVWPMLLEAEEKIDPADRRNRLMLQLAHAWEENPPKGRIIVAGTTGSIPATAKLIKAIAYAPQGCVILPGLDMLMDDESWEQVTDGHPQATLKNLLSVLDVARADVEDWHVHTDYSKDLLAANNTNNNAPPQTASHIDTTAIIGTSSADENINNAAPENPNTIDKAAHTNQLSMSSQQNPRLWLTSETMRPAATSEVWQNLSIAPSFREMLQHDLQHNLDLYECDNSQDEARLIAAILRHTVETSHLTAAVITPDRRLARRIAAQCRRWGIEVDDSAGTSLSASHSGSLLRLILRCVTDDLRPASLLALLRHPYCQWGGPRHAALTDHLEMAILRGPRPPSGFEGLRNHIASRQEAASAKNRPLIIDPDLNGFIDQCEAALAPLYNLRNFSSDISLDHLIKAHIAAAELCAAPYDAPEAQSAPQNEVQIAAQNAAQFSDNEQNDAKSEEAHNPPESPLWAQDDGRAAAQFVADLIQHGGLLPLSNIESYGTIFEDFLSQVTVRTPKGLHPRLFILGQLEARLVQADITIMAGLNEGTWPSEASPDPWLSRTMRRQIGLPTPERSMGLAAHDFMLGFCAKRTIMTRSCRVDGTQTVPARWLQRLDAVLQALQITPEIIKTPAPSAPPYRDLARAIDASPLYKPQLRPAPKPPVAIRPRRLPVTSIETWLRDPYSIYAQYILRLKPLDTLEQPPGNADRGNVLHDVLHYYVENHKTNWPPEAASILYDNATQIINKRTDDPGFWDFWLPRLESLTHWFSDHEIDWRENKHKVAALELSGSLKISAPHGAFTLTVKTDRIDYRPDGTAAIIDYKTGGASTYKKSRIANGYLPQLPLTAYILQQGGFTKITPRPVSYMGYWILTGADPVGIEEAYTLIEGKQDPQEVITASGESVQALIEAFDNENQPYYALPRPDHLPHFQNYQHLARVLEWMALGDTQNAD
jgi:ATP-dependent helicase/nuclease subunit B